MADNDEASGNEPADTPYIPTGLRRSTFTPATDDSALAAALAAEPTVRSSPVTQSPVQSASPVPSGAVPPVAAPSSAEQSDSDQVSDQEPAAAPVAAPAPEPEQQSELPDWPRRRSLADDDLVRKLNSETAAPGSTLGAIEELQAQMLLRQEEARQFGEWESGMRAIGTPEALDSITQAIPEFTGVIPIISPEQSAAYLADNLHNSGLQEAVENVQAPPASSPTTGFVTEPPSVQYMNPEEYPPPRLEERVDAAPLEEPNLSDHLVFQPPWKRASEPDEVPVGDAAAVPEEFLEQPDALEHLEPMEEPGQPEALEHATPVEQTENAEPVEAGNDAPSAEEESNESLAVEDTTEVPHSPVVYELVDPPSSGSVPLVSPQAESLFEQLLSGDVTESASADVAAPFPMLEVPQSVESTVTASQPIILPMIEDDPDDPDDPDDAVDEVDRAFEEQAEPDASAVALSSEAGEIPNAGEESLASEAVLVHPLASPHVQTDEQVVVTEEPQKQPIFGLELSGIEPTPMEHRVGRAARMFWLWFATNASVVSIAFGAALLGLGMSLRQAILAAFIGVAISFLPLGLGTLASKWSGQPTIVVSRATFGLVGNVVPAALALITRLFWGAVLLWLVAVCTARILAGASLAGPFSEMQLTLVVAAIGFVLAFLVAFLGYSLFARLQLFLSIVSAILILGLFVVTWNTIDIRAALGIGDGPWILVVTGVVLVFSFIGLVWATSSGDLARYQRQGSSGASASLWASFGATLPAFLLIAYGALLAASNPSLLKGFQTIPIDAIARLMPSWYPLPLIAATALSLLSAVALSLYAGGFALQAVGVRLQRQWAIVCVGVVIFGIAILMVLSDTGFATVFRDLATTLAVPIAAWAGIFAAEMMIRRRHFDTGSLLRQGGVYPNVNWINLGMLFVASALGFAFTSAAVGWLSWQGYGFLLFGVPLNGPVGASDLGVLVALAIGVLTPLVVGSPAVRRQESASR